MGASRYPPSRAGLNRSAESRLKAARTYPFSDFDPGGVADISRWSERSEDHRSRWWEIPTPIGVAETGRQVLRPLRGRNSTPQPTGGFAALNHRLISGTPIGVHSCGQTMETASPPGGGGMPTPCD